MRASKNMYTRAGYDLRPLTAEDEAILWEMVYQALSSPEGSAPDREIVHRPEYARYVEGWGGPHDQGFVAHDKEQGMVLGATWLRAPLDVTTNTEAPELALVVRAGHRQHGIGASLLTQLARANPHMTLVSLRLAPGSPAVRLFERFGFEISEQGEHNIVMRRGV